MKADYAVSVGDMKLIAVDVNKAFCSRGSYAAIGTDTSVGSWPTGDDSRGGDSSSVASKLASGIVDIFKTEYAFAALTDKGGLVTWGPAGRGGDSSSVVAQLASGVASRFVASVRKNSAAGSKSGSGWGGAFAGKLRAA